MNEKFAFLKSTRFYSMHIAALAIYLNQAGIIDEALSQLIATVSAGFLIVKSYDKTVDKFAPKYEEPTEE